MLKLGSVHDYPEVFHTKKTDAVLTDVEVDLLARIRDFRERRRWLLERVVMKDLAMEYLSANNKRYYPLNTIEIREVPETRFLDIHLLMEPQEERALRALSSSAGEMAVALVLPDEGDFRIGLSIERVERCYPFLVDKRFSAKEEAYLRGHSDQDVDASTTLFLEVKRLCNELFPEMGGRGRFFIDNVDGDEQVFLDTRQLALPGDYARSWLRSWHWDDYVILVAAFFSTEILSRGFDPETLATWV